LAALVEGKMKYTGVSLAGADFGEGNLPGVYDKDYTYPTHAEIDYFASKGFTTIRLPFRWERLQQKVRAEFDSFNFGKIKDLVDYTTSKGLYILLDPHNYARYYGSIIGDSSVTEADFADFWSRLATIFQSNSRVIFGLINEPNTMKTEVWLKDANAAIAAIRAVGAKNVIFVPGNAWSGASSWYDNWYGTSNAEVMVNIRDPGNNSVIEVHSYLDSDGSGTHAECVNTTIGSSRMSRFTSWCRENRFKAFLGEFAGSTDSTCHAAVVDALDFMAKNADVWEGFTWWAAGPWWAHDWNIIEPFNGQDAPQTGWLQAY